MTPRMPVDMSPRKGRYALLPLLALALVAALALLAMGETIDENLKIEAQTDWDAGEYTVRLGLWELATGERWLADGYPDGIVPLPVRCP